MVAEKLLELHKLIPIPPITKEELMADFREENAARRDFEGKWEHSLVALDKTGKPVGFLIAYERPGGEIEGVDTVSLYIHKFAVDTGWQENGIGTEMLRRLARNIEERGFMGQWGYRGPPYYISLQTPSTNKGAISFYKKIGFQKVGTRPTPERIYDVYLIKSDKITPALANPKARALSAARADEVIREKFEEFNHEMIAMIDDLRNRLRKDVPEIIILEKHLAGSEPYKIISDKNVIKILFDLNKATDPVGFKKLYWDVVGDIYLGIMIRIYDKQLAAMDIHDDDFIEYVATFRDYFMDKCGIKPKDVVLDIGTNMGWMAILAAEYAKNGKVIGIDNCPAAIEMARENAIMHGIPNAIFLERDATKTGLENGYFDVVISQYTINHMPEELRRRALREAYRLLGHGGALRLWEYHPGSVPMAWNVRTWQTELTAAGFKVEAIEEYDGYSIFIKARKPSRKSISSPDKTDRRKLPPMGGGQDYATVRNLSMTKSVPELVEVARGMIHDGLGGQIDIIRDGLRERDMGMLQTFEALLAGGHPGAIMPVSPTKTSEENPISVNVMNSEGEGFDDIFVIAGNASPILGAEDHRFARSDLDVCVAVSAYNKNTLKRFMVHILPSGHLDSKYFWSRSLGYPGADLEEAKKRYMAALFGNIDLSAEGPISGWRFVISKGPGTLTADPSAVISPEDVKNYLTEQKMVAADNIGLDLYNPPGTAIKRVVLDKDGVVSVFCRFPDDVAFNRYLFDLTGVSISPTHPASFVRRPSSESSPEVKDGGSQVGPAHSDIEENPNAIMFESRGLSVSDVRELGVSEAVIPESDMIEFNTALRDRSLWSREIGMDGKER